MKRYSNVHESFFDFLRGMSDKDVKDILLRLDKFIAENPEFSFDNKYNLPGICPIERIAQTIVITPDKLKKAIAIVGKKVEDISIYTLRGKLWTGDLLILSDSEVSSKKKKVVYRPELDYFYSQPASYQRKGRRKSSYNDLRYYSHRHNPYYAYESNTNEGKFSDFINFLESGKETKESIEFNTDLSLFKIYYFLDNNNSYDYDKKSDTPGIIFLSMLSEYTYVPYKELKTIIEKGLIPNTEIIRFNHKSIDGPVVLFHKPHERRENSYKKIYQEVFQEPFPSDGDELSGDTPSIPIPANAQQQLIQMDQAQTQAQSQAQAQQTSKIKNFLQIDPNDPTNKSKGFSVDQIKNPLQVRDKTEDKIIAIINYIDTDRINFANLVKDTLNAQKSSFYIDKLKTYLYEAPKTKGRLDNQKKMLTGLAYYFLQKNSSFFASNPNSESKFLSDNNLSDSDIKGMVIDMSIFLTKDTGKNQNILDKVEDLYKRLS